MPACFCSHAITVSVTIHIPAVIQTVMSIYIYICSGGYDCLECRIFSVFFQALSEADRECLICIDTAWCPRKWRYVTAIQVSRHTPGIIKSKFRHPNSGRFSRHIVNSGKLSYCFVICSPGITPSRQILCQKFLCFLPERAPRHLNSRKKPFYKVL